MTSQKPLTSRPPQRVDLGDLALVRSFEASREAFYAAVDASRAHLEPWMPWASGYEPERAREFAANAEKAWGDDQEYVYAVVEPSGEVVGAVGLHRRIGPGGLEIGYWVRADREGRGIVTRSSAALLDAAFAMPDIDRVEIKHDEANARSAAVPRRLGFTRVERNTREPEAPACSGVEIVWRLTREQYESRSR